MAAISWKSAVSGSWNNAADWGTGTVPAAGDDVTIGVGGSYTVSITAQPIEIASLTISDPSAVLAIDTSGAGGSNVAVTGTLANSGTLSNSGTIEIGNANLTEATTVSVDGLSNTGTIDLTGSATVQASLLVEPAAPTTLTGKYFLSGDAELGFETGGITAIGNSAELSLTGAKARVALGSAPHSNGVLTQLGSNVGTLRLEDGASFNTTVDFLNNGVIDVDDSLSYGGSGLAIGGTLTNRGNLVIGNSALTAPTTVTAAGLLNAGTIDLTGSGAFQATLKVTGAAPSTFTGINILANDALLEYGGGAINNIVIGSNLSLNGADARVALASAPNSNSALTKLEGNAGTFNLENGAVVAVKGSFTNTGATEVDINPGAGGSQLTIGGTLTNSAIISPNGLKIGNTTLSEPTLVTAADFSNTGVTTVTGALAVQAALEIAGAAPDTVTGVIDLTNDALLEYASGTITGIASGSTLFLDGAEARVALSAATDSNSALTTLTSNLGTFRLDGGAIVSTTPTTTTFANSGLIGVDDVTGSGGSRLTIDGTLSNNVTVTIGNSDLSTTTIVKATDFSNTGTLNLMGSVSVQATLDITGAAPGTLTGVNNLTNDALLEYGSKAITGIGSGATLYLDGAAARVALASAPSSNSALKQLASNEGTLRLDSGAVVATTTTFSNSGTVEVDDVNGSGGGSLTIGGTLTNGGALTIGNGALGIAATVTAAGLANSGKITLIGVPSVQATLDITAAVPTSGILNGSISLTNDALLEYASGAITSIASGAALDLTGAAARVADASATGSNSALTQLANNAGTLALAGGARLATTVALTNSGTFDIDATGAGGSTLTIGGALGSGSGTIAIGNSGSLSQVTTVTAAGLDLTGGTLNIVGHAATATLTLTGATSDAGSIAIGSAGVLALGSNSMSVVTPGTLTVNGGEISGGTLTGSGKIDSGASSSSTLAGVTIAAGTTFAAGANSFLTIDHVSVDGALTGGGNAGLVFGAHGTDTMTNIAGFPTIALADGGANKLTLKSANFAGVGSATITVYDGADGNTVTASSLPKADGIVVYAGGGADILTGGAGNDVFYAGGDTTMTGKGGANEFAFFGAGAANFVADFAASSSNELVFSNFGFSLGLGGASATPQALPTTLFVSNSTGAFANTTERFGYDTSNGKLLYSSDGSGSTPQLVATLTNHPTLAASQLFFVT